MPHPFLSDEWIEEARAIRAEVEAGQPPPVGLPDVRVNVVVTEVPVGDGTVHGHVDTGTGGLVIELGHVADPHVTVTVDHDTARSIFVDGETQAVMGAVVAGKVAIDGDLAQLLVLLATRPAAPAPGAEELAARLRAITV